jgi:sugar (pentulose or hexulose) kinase
MDVGHTVVLDVGKTVAKLCVLSDDGTIIERRERANERGQLCNYIALDARGIEDWLRNSLRYFASRHPIAQIVPVAHGAAAAIVRGGKLLCPPMDYETSIPEKTRDRYEALRDAFAVTGSPALPQALNLGLQLAWLEELIPSLLQGSALILPWAQYWAWVLSGIAASEVTSLGSHTDLWNPHERSASSLAKKRGWAAKLAPLKPAHERLGTIHPAWAAQTALSPETQILCGMHDSNAAFYAARRFAEIGDREATVLSTGTWFVAMRSMRRREVRASALPEHRDCLLNVDSEGNPVPSARFMGGREIELLSSTGSIDAPEDQRPMLGALSSVLDQEAMILPTVTPGIGPFPDSKGGWIHRPEDPYEQRAAVALYAALNTEMMLALLGTRERIVIEGRFARVDLFVRLVATLRRDCEVYVNPVSDGVALGALGLVNPDFRPRFALKHVAPIEVYVSAYRAKWLSLAAKIATSA